MRYPLWPWHRLAQHSKNCFHRQTYADVYGHLVIGIKTSHSMPLAQTHCAPSHFLNNGGESAKSPASLWFNLTLAHSLLFRGPHKSHYRWEPIIFFIVSNYETISRPSRCVRHHRTNYASAHLALVKLSSHACANWMWNENPISWIIILVFTRILKGKNALFSAFISDCALMKRTNNGGIPAFISNHVNISSFSPSMDDKNAFHLFNIECLLLNLNIIMRRHISHDRRHHHCSTAMIPATLVPAFFGVISLCGQLRHADIALPLLTLEN